MPDRDKKEPRAATDGFRETVAQWRLQLHTEVKRSSSLPTAMFDACDPMLETRLAETAKAMLACLQEPTGAPDEAPVDGPAKRLEQVAPGELRQLPGRIAAVATLPVDLEAGLLPEYLGILTDTCCLATGTAQNGAVQLLCRDFGLTAASDPGQLMDLLMRQVAESLAGCPGANEASAQALASACQRLTAALLLHLPAEGHPRGAL